MALSKFGVGLYIYSNLYKILKEPIRHETWNGLLLMIKVWGNLIKAHKILQWAAL